MRVVSLSCSNTEIVSALELDHMLVGIDDHSDRPVEVVAGLPRLGPDLDIDIEAVCNLDPDLVLASLTVPGHERVVEGLEQVGLEYLAPEPIKLADVYDNIRLIGRTLGAPERAESLIEEMRSRIKPGIERRVKPAILVQWWNRPTIAPGRDSWVTDLIDLAGGRNPLADEPVKSKPLDDEQVAELDPNMVVLSWCGVDPAKYRPDVIYRNPAWQELSAVQGERVYCVPEAYLGRPGPGLVEGFQALSEIVAHAHR